MHTKGLDTGTDYRSCLIVLYIKTVQVHTFLQKEGMTECKNQRRFQMVQYLTSKDWYFFTVCNFICCLVIHLQHPLPIRTTVQQWWCTSLNVEFFK